MATLYTTDAPKIRLSLFYRLLYGDRDNNDSHFIELDRDSAGIVETLKKKPEDVTDAEKRGLEIALEATPPYIDVMSLDDGAETKTLFELAYEGGHVWAYKTLLDYGAKKQPKSVESKIYMKQGFPSQAMHAFDLVDQPEFAKTLIAHSIGDEIFRVGFGVSIAKLCARPGDSGIALVRDCLRRMPSTDLASQLMEMSRAVWVTDEPFAVIAANQNIEAFKALWKVAESALEEDHQTLFLSHANEAAIRYCSPDFYQALRDIDSPSLENNTIFSELHAWLISAETGTGYLAKHPEKTQDSIDRFAQILPLLLEDGLDPIDGDVAQRYDEATMRFGLADLAVITQIQYGFPLLDAHYYQTKLAEKANDPELVYKQFYRDYHDAYHELFEQFKARNPYTHGDELPQKQVDLRIYSDDPETMPWPLLAEGELEMLHAFSAIGKLHEAFSPAYWRGDEDKALELIGKLYPYEQKQVARECSALVAQLRPAPQIWQASVEAQAQASGVAHAV